MFAWWLRRKRDKILERAFPDAWKAILQKNVPYVRSLDEEEVARLQDLVQVFVSEKIFVGCGGLQIDDEIRVTIAASACILLLGIEHDLYVRVESILVYPSSVRPPQWEPNVMNPQVSVVEGRPLLLGEAHLRGPVILVWDAVEHGNRHPTMGHNVVFHEFAHKLDMLDGDLDGTPPLRSTEQYKDWGMVCGRVYKELRAKVEAGEPTLLDPYGATSEAEFFAVATEYFFERAVELERQQPDLYDVLHDFYQQDPAGRNWRA